nr:MAG: hypothetical protein DIU55_13270 [Bacillota bacterium]
MRKYEANAAFTQLVLFAFNLSPLPTGKGLSRSRTNAEPASRILQPVAKLGPLGSRPYHNIISYRSFPV